jgi:NitT/TauT family transport system substrate-binding protein
MTQDVLDQAREKMRAYGIVPRRGVGRMDDARWAEFFKVASEQGVYPKDMDYKSAYTLDFLPK